MKNRIKLIMEQRHLSQQDFAALLGVSAASLSSIFTGRTNPTNKHVQAVHRAFPNVNVNWLLFGEGEMYVNATTPEEASAIGDIDDTLSETASTAVDDGRENTATPMLPHTEAAHMPSMFTVDGGDASTDGRMVGNASPTLSRSRGERRVQEARPYTALQKNPNIIDKPERRIKEIRVFYDDGTYEAFVPSSK